MAIAMRYGTPGESSGAVGGGSSGGGVTCDLLWTNPNPDSNFSAQTVTLDLSAYDAVLVVCRMFATTTYYFTNTCMVGLPAILNTLDVSGNRYGRTADVTTTGIVFGQGYSNGTASASRVIPVSIYGIKF